MPLYDWVDLNTGQQVTVYRRAFADSQEPPTVAEEREPSDQERQWQRLIGKGIKVIKSNTWGGGKGQW